MGPARRTHLPFVLARSFGTILSRISPSRLCFHAQEEARREKRSYRISNSHHPSFVEAEGRVRCRVAFVYEDGDIALCASVLLFLLFVTIVILEN